VKSPSDPFTPPGYLSPGLNAGYGIEFPYTISKKGKAVSHLEITDQGNKFNTLSALKRYVQREGLRLPIHSDRFTC